MKPLHAFTFLVLSVATAAAQTNVFPSSGNVGIGTTTPQYPLALGGAGYRVGFYSDPSHFNSIEFYNASTGGMVFDHNTAAGGGYTWNFAGTPLVNFKANGNVGIGTTNPADKLTVSGNVAADGVNVIGGVARYYSGGGAYLAGHAGSPWAAFQAYSDEAGTGKALALNPNGGNVGIGTTNPSYPLEIASINSLSIAYQRTGVSAKKWGFLSDNYNTYWHNLTDNVLALTVSNDGNVGIGTTSPSEKLSVNGRIRAKEVIVETTGWSDYVFAKDYKLASLGEVEQHIHAKGHLPGIPSATEVAEKGVSVGDMQAVLLAKIEELTLHVIAQEKHRTAQDQEIAQLRAEMQQLRQSK